MNKIILLLLVVVFVAVNAKGPYKVVGNKIQDGNGNNYRFLGVDRPSLEWSPYGDRISQNDFNLMAGWGSNVVRIALNQDYLIPGANNYSASYNNTVFQAVQWAKNSGQDVILDLHWSDAGNLRNTKPGQQKMADENSITFWKLIANIYKNDPAILFELYNEPHDVSWDVWQKGGSAGEFNAAGYQQLYDAVRSTGANNLVLIGGLNWAYDLSGVPSHKINGDNIVYVTHPYDYPGKQPSDWDNAFGNLASQYPVIATEFGDGNCSPTYYQNLVNYAEQKGIHWTSWAWYVAGCEFPSIINDWNGTPSASGNVIKAALQKH